MGIQALRGVDKCLPRHVSGSSGIYWLSDAKEVPDTQVMTYDYGDLVLVWELRSFQNQFPLEGTTAATAFYGTQGSLLVDGRGWKVYADKGEVMQAEKRPAGRTRRTFSIASRVEGSPMPT